MDYRGYLIIANRFGLGFDILDPSNGGFILDEGFDSVEEACHMIDYILED